MANEAVIIELINGGTPVRRTVADGTTISKGTLLKLADPNTASASSANADVFGGIAAADKLANDGSTTLAAWTDGVFDIKAGSATFSAGAMVKLSGANLVSAALAADLLTGTVVGFAEETASADEVVRVRLRGY